MSFSLGNLEKLNFVRNGVIRLPPGFRFCPTDEELVVQYLRRKVFGCPLPASIIPEVDICKYDPCQLPGDPEKERYFFTTRESKYPNGNRSNRSTGSGYWKATGVDKQIVAGRSNQIVGLKKTLVFYRGKATTRGVKTEWIMHEYRLVGVGNTTTIFSKENNSIQNFMVEREDWVVCRIFQKKISTRNENEITQRCSRNGVVNDVTVTRPRFIDFLKQDNTDLRPSSSSSSSASSEIID
ncbi:hypothetical protein GIB67_041834 [Kingdonia uniflora]|uniref:NAC domain-containing protein n=1 Tax=Kingdonia uniflora TaxID=39325 RepID=A0A7J7L5P1_9MAGN|nr:hypothetical protein GIB67_041834 [Kingdonia uniflora]